MKKQTLKLSFLMLILMLYSCQKERPNEPDQPEQVDVYVAGFVSDDANYHYPDINPYGNSNDHPTYWKNGRPVQLDYGDFLPDGNNKSGRALSIAVSGNIVYVTGYGTWTNDVVWHLPYGMFWKNSIPLDPDSMNIWGTREVNSLAVSNNDTYTVGWGQSDRATYWKNENQIELTPPYSSTGLNISATATSIAVSGNDVYVSGAQREQLSPVGGFSNVTAEYWKNGDAVNLSDGAIDTYTTSIAVSGNYVYVAGSDKNGIAKYWNNGNLVNLTDGSTAAEANSIAVSGTDVYVAGTQWDGNSIQYNNGINYTRNPIAKYWKNGIPVNLTDGSKWAEARSIVISGNDVYVAGFEDAVAKYWKNGNPVILGDASKNSEAYSIFLVKH